MIQFTQLKLNSQKLNFTKPANEKIQTNHLSPISINMGPQQNKAGDESFMMSSYSWRQMAFKPQLKNMKIGQSKRNRRGPQRAALTNQLANRDLEIELNSTPQTSHPDGRLTKKTVWENGLPTTFYNFEAMPQRR